MRKPLTCPLTGHRETVELETTPVGLVVARCSRFLPSEQVTCSRECTRRLDVRARVVLVGPLRVWGYARTLTDYMREHLDALDAMPTWFISVARGESTSADRLWREVGWCPPGIAGFDGTALEPRAHELARMISDDIPLDHAP